MQTLTPVWRWVRASWPFAVCLALVAIESSSVLSAANTGRVIHRVAVALFGRVDAREFATVHRALRKAGHVVGYGGMSVLLFRALRRTADPASLSAKLNLRLAGCVLVAISMVATIDEWHQSLLPTRTGRYQDVLLDIAGGVTCLTAVFIWMQCRRPQLPSGVRHGQRAENVGLVGEQSCALTSTGSQVQAASSGIGEGLPAD